MKKIILFLILSNTYINSYSQGIVFEHGSFQEALNKAKAEKKMLFMDCYTNWCGPCKMLQNNTFPNEEVGTFFNDNFICYKIECEHDEGPTICNRFVINAYPTLLFIDGDGNIVQKSMGYRPPESLISEGKRALGGSTALLSEYKTKYQNGDKSEAILKGLVLNLAKNGESFDIYWKEYLATQKSEYLLSDENAKMIFELTNSINSPSISYFKQFKDFFIEKYGAESYERKQESIVSKSIKDAILKNDKTIFNNAILLIQSNKMSRGTEFIQKQSMIYYSGVNDMVNYDKIAMEYLKKSKNIAPTVFIDIMDKYIRIIENPSLLNKAVAICKKSISKENKYYNNLILASLLYKMNNKTDAYAIGQYAIELGKIEGVNYWPAQELVNKIQIERGAKQ
ncbi:MAG: thioredoxin domain-containing protein [Bacteroidota bacterium]